MTTKKALLILTLIATVGLWVAVNAHPAASDPANSSDGAQSSAPKDKGATCSEADHMAWEHHHGMKGDMKGHMMDGDGMMGGDHMGGMHMLMEPGATLTVKNLKNGIAIEVTSDDSKAVERLQKKGQILQLMHDLYGQDKDARP